MFQSHVKTFEADVVIPTAIQTKTLINLKKGGGLKKTNKTKRNKEKKKTFVLQ